MKKGFLLVMLILLVSCGTSNTTQNGYLIDQDLVYIEDVGPIMHDTGDIPVGSTITMRYDGAYMDSFPMQVDDTVKFTKNGTEEHILTSIVKIIEKLKETKPEMFEAMTKLNLSIDGLEGDNQNTILFMLSKRFEGVQLSFAQQTSDSTFIALYFDDIGSYGDDQVVFSADLIAGTKQYIVDQGHLNKKEGLYEVEFFSTTEG